MSYLSASEGTAEAYLLEALEIDPATTRHTCSWACSI